MPFTRFTHILIKKFPIDCTSSGSLKIKIDDDYNKLDNSFMKIQQLMRIIKLIYEKIKEATS